MFGNWGDVEPPLATGSEDGEGRSFGCASQSVSRVFMRLKHGGFIGLSTAFGKVYVCDRFFRPYILPIGGGCQIRGKSITGRFRRPRSYLLTKIWGAECCVMGVDAVPVHVNNRIQYGNTAIYWFELGVGFCG